MSGSNKIGNIPEGVPWVRSDAEKRLRDAAPILLAALQSVMSVIEKDPEAYGIVSAAISKATTP